MQSRSGEGNVYPAPTLATIPIEMLEGICRFLLQKGLFSQMLCNSKSSAAAAQYLYMEVSLFPIPKCCFLLFWELRAKELHGRLHTRLSLELGSSAPELPPASLPY
jgi:hypothetical protein